MFSAREQKSAGSFHAEKIRNIQKVLKFLGKYAKIHTLITHCMYDSQNRREESTMDTFEEYYVEESQPVQQKQRKASPFADSPYDSPYTNFVSEEPAKTIPVKKNPVGRRIVAIVCAICVVVVCCGATALIAGNIYDNRLEQAERASQQQISQLESRLEELEKQNTKVVPGNVPSEGMSPGQIYSAVVDSVVCISAYAENIDGSAIGSSGSGFIFSQNGHVVTNYHVVADMTELTVILNDKTELPAQLVGFDASADIAVLKVDAEDLPCAEIGSSSAIKVGAQVVAIGYPLSSDTASMTVGYVSAKDQVVSTDGSVANMLQTDAAINSGNSGGPLFNSAGQVVGITTSKFSGYSTSGVSIEGMGFAIPIDDVLKMIEDLCEFGYVTGAYLGVYVRDVDAYVQAYGLPAGAYVDEATDGLAAQRGGIKAGDVITALGGYDVESVADLTLALRRFNPYDEVSVTVWRNGKNVNLTVVLDEKPVAEIVETPEETVPQEESMEQWEDWFVDPFFEMFPDMDD